MAIPSRTIKGLQDIRFPLGKGKGRGNTVQSLYAAELPGDGEIPPCQGKGERDGHGWEISMHASGRSTPKRP